MKPDFVHLHVHSHFSLLDGAGKIDDLLARAKELGMNSLALTDHGSMFGIIQFYEKASKHGIKPILGVEAYVAPRGNEQKDPKVDSKAFHLILLAENYTGYLNLIKIVSNSHLSGFYYKPRTDKEFLKKHSEGVIALSACLNGEIPRKVHQNYELGKKTLAEYVDIFGKDNFFLELQNHPNSEDQKEINELLIKLSEESGVGLVCTNDIHYILPEDAEAQDVLVCVATGKTVNDTNRMNYLDFDLSMSTPEQMYEAFKEHPEALENTVKIAERCNVTIPMGENILPKYPLPEGMTDREYLKKLCSEGIKHRYNFDYTPRNDRPEKTVLESPLNNFEESIEERASKRLEYELSVIETVGYESYFLIVQDFINWSRDHKVMVGPGRGSAAGSLVCFLIGITDVDPLEHSLIFERFLNPERISMPDIDTDIEDTRRDEVIQYTRERYGSDHVAQIITFGTMAARNAIRDVGRALGVPYNECDYIAKLIPSGPGGMNLKEALENLPEVKAVYTGNEQHKKLLDIAIKLEGVARHTSVHAARVVITRDPLTEYVPLQRAVKDENTIVTQYEGKEVEHIGLLKMDFLGLSNLGILQQAIRVIRKTRGVEIDLRTLQVKDEETYKLLARAESTGVFQLESSGMKRYLKELKPTQFEDIVSMVALYRPGPMDSIPDFIESKHGRKKITYLHPILEPILKNTYGVIVTQDQVLEIARKFSGFTYGEADVLRKAVGKKIKSLLDEQKDKFIKGAITSSKVSKDMAQKVWDFIEPFARYGFNRAHAVCYAFIAYQTAYLKAHYPVEFMASLLTSDINNLDRVGIEIAECKDMGIEVLPPDINESFVEFGAILYQDKTDRKFDSYIRFGLGAIKNVGIAPTTAIVEERKNNGPYKNFDDFLVRNCVALNKKVIENLAMAGALDTLCERQCILYNMEVILNFITNINKHNNSNQFNLFGDKAEDNFSLTLLDCKPSDKKTNLMWERTLLGIYVSDHPINHYLKYLPEERTAISELSKYDNDTDVKVAGIVMSIHKILTKKNENMAFVMIEDDTNMVEVILFPKVWKLKEKVVEPGNAVIIEGKISRKDARKSKTETADSENAESENVAEEIKILVNNCTLIDESNRSNDDDNNNSGHIKIFDREKANKMIINIPEDGDRKLLMQIKEHLEEHPGGSSVTLMMPSLDGHQALNIAHKVELCDVLFGKLCGLIGDDAISLE